MRHVKQEAALGKTALHRMDLFPFSSFVLHPDNILHIQHHRKAHKLKQVACIRPCRFLPSIKKHFVYYFALCQIFSQFVLRTNLIQYHKSGPPAQPVACSTPIRGCFLLAPGRRTEGLPTAPHPQPPLKGLFQCFLPPAQPPKGLAGLL